jgi:hypothetical protein
MDTTRAFTANGMAEGYLGAFVNKANTCDLEAGLGVSPGVRTGPLRGIFAFDSRLSFRATFPKLAIVTGLYSGVTPLIAAHTTGEVHTGLAFAVQPVIGKNDATWIHELGIEFQGGIGLSTDSSNPSPLTGQFALRVYYDQFGGVAPDERGLGELPP